MNTLAYRVRDAVRKDAHVVGEMWRELMQLHATLDPRFRVSDAGETLYRRHTEEMIRSRDGKVLLAEIVDTNYPIGFLLAEIHARPLLPESGDYGLISDVFVRERWRRQGVGRALFEAAMHWFRTRAVRSVQLYVSEANPGALAFWHAVGMRPYLRVLQQDLFTPEDIV